MHHVPDMLGYVLRVWHCTHINGRDLHTFLQASNSKLLHSSLTNLLQMCSAPLSQPSIWPLWVFLYSVSCKMHLFLCFECTCMLSAVWSFWLSESWKRDSCTNAFHKCSRTLLPRSRPEGLTFQTTLQMALVGFLEVKLGIDSQFHGSFCYKWRSRSDSSNSY